MTDERRAAMIPAALLGLTAPPLDAYQRARRSEALRARTGSEWLELQIAVMLRLPELWPDPPLLDPRWWRDDPRGFALRALADALQRHEHLQRVARSLTPDQIAELWQDPSEQAAELRRVMRSA